MSDEDVSVVRAAYEAYGQGEEMNRLLELVQSPDLGGGPISIPAWRTRSRRPCSAAGSSWPGFWGSKPTRALSRRWRSLPPAIDKVMRWQGPARWAPIRRRAWRSKDHSYLVLTMDRGTLIRFPRCVSFWDRD